MLTNEGLGKRLGCHQTESGMSSPPDCGARKYPHGALGAADSGHSLFCEHRRALLGCWRESQPCPGPHMWGANPFSTGFSCDSGWEARGGRGWGVRGAGGCLSEAWIALNTAFSILVSHENHRCVLHHKGVSNLESDEVPALGTFLSHPTPHVHCDHRLETNCCIYFFSTTKRTKKSQSLWGDHQQPLCSLGSRWRAGSTIQDHLFSHCWWPDWWICESDSHSHEHFIL